MNALSVLFPGGERFFITSTQNFQRNLKDSELKNSLKIFCGQESIHGKQYEKFNAWLAQMGYPVKRWEYHFEKLLHWRAQFYGKQLCLAITAALEHVTAVLGSAVLSCPTLQEAFHNDVRPLVIWHAVEEVEHKAVAFDVMCVINSNYILRVVGFLIALLELSINFSLLLLAFLRHDQETFNVRSLFRLIYLGASSGFMTKTIWHLIQYLRPNFHPWQSDDSHLIEKFDDEIKQFLTQ
jgi:predicted metal-dependent hydrolase